MKEVNQSEELSKEDCVVWSVKLISQGQGYHTDDVASRYIN